MEGTGVYIHEKALFDRLVAAQERMSGAILKLIQRRREWPELELTLANLSATRYNDHA